MELRAKVVVVTGASRGIGLAVAKTFAAQGADLALVDLQGKELDAACRACGESGVRARGYVANVASEAEVVAAMEAIAHDFGRLDGLVNNAGILRDGLLVKVREGQVVDKLSLARWQAVIDVNLTGVFLCAREAAERMIRFGAGGVIVNIASISKGGNAGQSNYSAAKAGVDSMTVVWAKELARHGIRVGAVAPGFVRTDLLDAMKHEMLQKMLAPVPLGRLGEAAEVARAVQFIFENEFFTGRSIDLDGGLRL